MDDQTSKFYGKRLLTSSELAAFCMQVSMILKAGIPLHDGLSLLQEDLADQKLAAVLKEVSDAVAERKPLHAALEHTSVFPAYMVNMVHIGSDSGKLDDVLLSLSAYYEREDSLRQTIRSAVVYPMALITMMLIVMLILSAKVLPVFEQVFRGLGTSMSPAATAIMNFGLATSKYSLVLLVFGALILVGFVFLFRSERGGEFLSRVTASGRMAEKVSIARFSSSMSLMLTSGLDTEHALKLSKSVISSNKIKDKIDQCLILIENNVSFLDAISKTALYPQMTIRMLSLGFQAGNLDTVMHRVAETEDAEIEAALYKRVSMIEPISVAFLSVLIGVILISVMLPLMSVMSSIG